MPGDEPYKAYSDKDREIEAKLLNRLAHPCGAAAASVIQLDRSGKNWKEGEGLLFQQVVKSLHNGIRPGHLEWRYRTVEFFESKEGWGVTGESAMNGLILDVRDIQLRDGTWKGTCFRFDLDGTPVDKGVGKQIDVKRSYCEAIQIQLGEPLSSMLVAPIISKNIVAGAIKLFNHHPQRCKGCETAKGFSDHMTSIVGVMAELSNYWLANYPLRCEVAAVYVDIVDATSFLIASGYQEGARVLQRFTERVDVALKKVVEQIETRARKDPNSYLAKMGGTPFFEKFTGDGMLLVFPYDRAALRAHPGTRTDDELGEQSIWEHIHQVLLSINDRWLEVLEEPQPKRVLREAALYTQPPRIAISSGPAYLGRFGPQLSVIGRPIIEAARLIELRDEYLEWEQAHYSARVPRSGNFLASGQFVHDFGLDKEGAEPLNKYQLRGLPGRRIVWKVPILRERPRRQFA